MAYLTTREPDRYFSLRPEDIFEQAVASSKVLLGVPCANSYNGKRDAYFLLFTRRAYLPAKAGFSPERPDGTSLQVEIVAYECDAEGNVFDWESRYEDGGVDVTAATHGLCLALCNGVAQLYNFAGVLERLEARRAELEARAWDAWDADLGELARLQTI